MTETRKSIQQKAADAAKAITPLDALALADNELGRLLIVMEDLQETARMMAVHISTLDDERNEYGAFLRMIERVLDAEIMECDGVQHYVQMGRKAARAARDAAMAKDGAAKA